MENEAKSPKKDSYLERNWKGPVITIRKNYFSIGALDELSHSCLVFHPEFRFPKALVPNNLHSRYIAP